VAPFLILPTFLVAKDAVLGCPIWRDIQGSNKFLAWVVRRKTRKRGSSGSTIIKSASTSEG
jgi:hypothetical protein